MQEEQKGAAASPAFVASAADLGAGIHDLELLATTTGMYLSLGTGCTGGPPDPAPADLGGVAAAAAAGHKWCPGCPHKRKDGTVTVCFQAPEYTGPPPINVYINKERWAGIVRAKAANAKKSGQPNATVRTPSQEDVDKYLANRKARREKERAGGKRPAAGVPGGAAAASADLEEWRSSLLDLTIDSDFAGMALPEWPLQEQLAHPVMAEACGYNVSEYLASFLFLAPDHAAMMAIGDDDGDDDEADNGADIPQHWFVLMPTGEAPAEILCMADPNDLEYDADLHTPVGFGADEQRARQVPHPAGIQ